MIPDLLAITSHPVFISGATVLVVGIANLALKSLRRPGRLSAVERRLREESEKVTPLLIIPDQVEELQRRQTATEALSRLILQNLADYGAGIRTLLDIQAGAEVNGNVTHSLGRLDRADERTQSFLVDTATGGN